MAGLDGVAPALANAFLRLQAAAAQAGFNLGIASGYRDAAAQQRLRVAHCCNDPNSSKCGCGPPTAPVGRSNHQHGLAIDLSGTSAAKAWANANGAKFGVHFPVAGEDWHMELIGGGEHAGHAQAAEQMGIGIKYMQQDQDPLERIGSYMDAIVGAQRDELLSSPGSDALSSPMAPEVAAPEFTAGSTPDTSAPPPIGMETIGQPGAPGAAAPPGGGGQWRGDIPPPGYVPPGTGVGRWRDVALAALRYTGQDPGMINLLLKRMAQESSGNPTVVNNWDENAQRGDPSKGLMQNIGSAFAERARELTNRGIFDGFANIVASIRYTLGRYGSLQKGWSRPGGY
jgi:hypothetical protein